MKYSVTELKDVIESSRGFDYLSSLENSLELQNVVNFRDKTVIGCGEATHSSREFNEVRSRFFRLLVEELDYRIFAWEASFGETIAINDYVLNGEGTAEEALKSVSSPNCKMEEVLDLIEWIREYNKEASEGEKVKFYGFDMQNDIASFQRLQEKMGEVDRDFVEENRDIFEFAKQGKMMFADIDGQKETELRNFGQKLNQRIEKRRDDYLEKTSAQEYGLLKQLGVIFEQCRKYCLAMNENASFEMDSWSFRDRSMAENISWMMEFEDEEKAFLWAHNAHIKKSGKPEKPESKALGYFLNQKFGEDYYAVGFDFGTGMFKYLNMEEPQPEWNGERSFDSAHKDTLAQELEKFEQPFFLDFNSIQDENLKDWANQRHRIHSVGTYFHLENISDHYDDVALDQNFDALIFLPQITASEPI